MMPADIAERLRAFEDFAACHEMRGNQHAAAEAREDADRLRAQYAGDEDAPW
jgi:hypothetical protein